MIKTKEKGSLKPIKKTTAQKNKLLRSKAKAKSHILKAVKAKPSSFFEKSTKGTAKTKGHKDNKNLEP